MTFVTVTFLFYVWNDLVLSILLFPGQTVFGWPLK